MEELLTVNNMISLLSLTALELVLGIDNILFISILAEKLPVEKRSWARKVGLAFALIGRLILLAGVSWLVKFQEPILSFWKYNFSIRDFIVLGGGLFLLYKGTMEIFHFTEAKKEEVKKSAKDLRAGMLSFITQVILIDLVFSFDSVVTAIGMTDKLMIMCIAVIISILVMIVFANKIANFIEAHPSIKMLALTFLILVGVLLIADGFGEHFNRGYVYFAMAFSISVEILNMRRRKNIA